MGLSPKQWGKQAWHFIHMVALNYPVEPKQEDKDRYTKFLKSLGFVLPCEICSEHWKEKIKEYPPNLNNREEFFKWTVDMHNQVNKSNNKRQITYKEAMNETIKNAQTNPKADYLTRGILLSMSAISLIFLFSYAFAKKK
jgi:hypothetical protein